MRKIAWLLMGLGLLGLAACSSANLKQDSAAGSTDKAANVGAGSQDAGAKASTSQTGQKGMIEGSFKSTVDEEGVDTDVDFDIDVDTMIDE